MTKDNTHRINKPELPKRSKRIAERNRLKKTKENSSDSDNNSDSDNSDNSDSDTNSDYSADHEDQMDIQEYRKFLKKLFPSKYLDDKIKKGQKYNKCTNKKKKETSDYSSESEKEMDDEEEEWEESEEWEEDEELEEELEEEHETRKGNKTKKEKNNKHKNKNKKGKSEKFNIIFTIGNKEKEIEEENEYDEYFENEWETENESETENEDESVSSDSDSSSTVTIDKKKKINKEKNKEKEKDKNKEKEKDKNKEKEKEKKNTIKTKDRELNNPNIELNEDKEDIEKKEEKIKEKLNVEQIENKNKELITVLKGLQEQYSDNDAINDCIKVCEDKIKTTIQKIEKKSKKQKNKNERIFRKILADKNTMNDFSFFNKMEMEEQKKIIKELREINKISRIEKPYRLTLLESSIPTVYKASAMKKISSLKYMDSGSGEYFKIKNWVDTFMRIPFGKYEQLPITIEDGVENCHNFMESAQQTLDAAVYGLNDAKMQIMQMLGQLITNPKSIGTTIAIHGPPGTGKTSLVKEGISKILNRPFSFIALGGATDSSFLEGHSYTYEGSTWGKIVQILIDSKCMNPVIYFDELDKISDTPKGEEIAGILTHLTDTSQNSQFHDKYFSDIDFDISKCLFIFSYNDEKKVNPILRDRMYRIQTKGYEKKQKTIIATKYLLPKIREQVKFYEESIIIPEETIYYIIENFCDKEDGVRNLKRCLEIIYTKLNLYRLMKPNSNLFEQDMSLTVTFPYTVTRSIVDKLIKINKEDNFALNSLYI